MSEAEIFQKKFNLFVLLQQEVFGEADVDTFHWADYTVFCASLLISLAIGLYFAVSGDKQRTTEEFLLAGRSAGIVPVAMSSLASFVSAVYVISIPAEIMYNGTMFSMQFIGYFMFTFLGAHVFLPFFHKRGQISAYKYLEERFNYPVRVLGTALFIIMMVLYLSIVLRGPALAFEEVMDIKFEYLVVILGVLCTVYTTIGGIKAVLWTDTFQMSVVLIGLVVLLILGIDEVGGVSKVLDIADENGRIEYDNISGDYKERHTLWTQSFGTMFTLVSLVGANQTIIQRYLSVKKVRQAQVAAYGVCLLACVVLFLVTGVGLAMFAYYHSCDPIATMKIDSDEPDKIVPMYMMAIIGDYPGLPGLYTAAVFSASLSSVSSALNSLSAVVLEDIVKPGLKFTGGTITDVTATRLSKGVSVFFGLITIGLSFIDLGDVLIQVALTIFGTAGGPLMGIFALGMFFTFTESWGTFVGGIIGTVLVFWVNIGALVKDYDPIPKPVRIDGCPFQNITVGQLAASQNLSSIDLIPVPDSIEASGVDQLYRLSYGWYGALATVSTVVIGLAVSGVINCVVRQKLRDSNAYYTGLPCCPLPCGVSSRADGTTESEKKTVYTMDAL